MTGWTLTVCLASANRFIELRSRLAAALVFLAGGDLPRRTPRFEFLVFPNHQAIFDASSIALAPFVWPLRVFGVE
jgi:hypothetical protein